ncbi:hypothetical protein PHLGIDRAFT_299520 [Phlebiopsis gigantea 11061_1 CR5-6]|uniref:F-box domain-containing protein n=1 Tax=Phlebiopsis gigantea (strain 11061_1 CR5-6) TaxID=745531 RepID=A0A0C3S0A1_PHLG1|nr:hypothetical protein PHLGIDRAFT_299520 [Phlebiopsis gigantea 11061_1 CR5-6]
MPSRALSDCPRLLPPEVLAIIFEQATTEALPSILLASSSFHALGVKSLYQSITSRVSPCKHVLRLRALACASASRQRLPRLPNPALSVRRLRIDFHVNVVNANLLRLIYRALREMKSLIDLELDFGLATSYTHTAWCLRGVSSRLETLHTSTAVDDTLIAWLNMENQRSIKTLSLRGHPLYSRESLSPDSLPALTAFRSVHLRSAHIATFVRGRPVENAAATLFIRGRLEELDALKLASVPLKRTTLLCLEERHLESLIPALAARFPLLDGLHIVTIAIITIDHLKGMTAALSGFSQLRHITFMASESSQLTGDQEREVVHEWAAACSTLATVILTGGVVWYPEPESRRLSSP